VKVGGAYRNRSRDFAARRLNWRFLGNTVQDLDQALSTATIVDQVRNPGEFAIDEVVEPGDLYGATDERMGGYGQLTVPFGNLEAIAGLRVESYSLGLDSRGSTLQDVSQVDLAPSLNLIFKPRADVRFRGAISQTVDRPEFRELAPFQFTEATSLRQLYGNPELIPATILNTDLRADWFPQPGEIISIGGFYKRLENPIEQVFLAAASDAYSFQNAERAEIRGIELDVQLSLARLANMLDGLSMQTNYSWINSQVTVRQGTGGFEPTNLDRPLEGQASYVLNAGLNYATFSGLEAGVFFNRFGKRLTAAGGSGIPDLYEKPRNSLDASFGFPIPTASGARVKISGSNLLDSEYRFEQSANGITQVQQLYTVGRTFSVGLSWEF
jgi:TonB-dependent receptor